jgi:hypothetical protein
MTGSGGNSVSALRTESIVLRAPNLRRKLAR